MSRRVSEAQPPLSDRLPIVTYTNAWDEPVRALWVSPQVERIVGYTPEEWRSPGFFEAILHPADRGPVLAETGALRTELRPFSRDYRLVRRDGQVVWIHDESVPILDEDGRPEFVQGYFIDISERKRLEEALGHAQKSEALARLAGGIAHDFNNLLTAVAGLTDLAGRGLERGHPVHGHLGDIVQTVRRGVRLTRQLLAFSRRQPLEVEVVELGSVVEAMEPVLLHVAGAGVELTVDVRDSAPVAVDVGQLEQVLMNLVANARDAMPDGGRVSITTARLTLSRSGDAKRLDLPRGEYAVFVVADTGQGMEPETRARMFDPFFTTKRRDAGTGLGLSMVHGIVRQSGGAIDVASAHGRGTTVRILLPVAAVG
jgi:two-component system, cell cycle sensor histidine kinase and response regulator CckA